MLTESIAALVLVGTCVIIHCSGIVVLGSVLVRRRQAMQRGSGSQTINTGFLLITVFAALILLHIVENCIWAAFYGWCGLFGNYETSLYFSLGSYSTIGYGDVVLPEKWRLLGALEGISGVLLCGLSTAFLFSVMNALFRFRIQRLKQETYLGDGN